MIKATLTDQEIRLESLAALVEDVSERQLTMLRSMERLTAAVERIGADRAQVCSSKQAEAKLQEASVAYRQAAAQSKTAADRVWQLEDAVRSLTDSSEAATKQLATTSARVDSAQSTISKVQGSLKGVQQRVDDLQGSIETNLANMQLAADSRGNAVQAQINHALMSVDQLAQQLSQKNAPLAAPSPAASQQPVAGAQSVRQLRSTASARADLYDHRSITTGGDGPLDDLLRRSRGVAESLHGLRLTRQALRQHGSPPSDPSDSSSSSSSSSSTSASDHSDRRKRRGSRHQSERKRSSHGDRDRCRSPSLRVRSRRSDSDDDHRGGYAAERRRESERSKRHHRGDSVQRHSERRSQQSSRRERERSGERRRPANSGADSAASQPEELPMIGLSSLSFAPPSNYEKDPAWCTKQLDMLWDVVVQQGAIARSKMRGKRKQLKPGMIGAQWHRPVLTHMAQALTQSKLQHPRADAFAANIRQWQSRGDSMLLEGSTDEQLWSWLSGQIVQVFMDQRPEELSTQLAFFTVPSGARVREAAVALQQHVNTAVSASVRSQHDGAFDQLRKSAVLGFIQRQFPDSDLQTQLREQYNDDSCTAQDMCTFVVEHTHEQNLTAKAPADKVRYPVTTVLTGADNDEVNLKQEQRKKDRERRKNDDMAMYAMQLEEQLAVSDNTKQWPCYNCGKTDHRWLKCPDAYNAERWKAWLSDNKASRWHAMAPRSAQQFNQARTRHSKRDK